jgi:hypothetical protein
MLTLLPHGLGLAVGGSPTRHYINLSNGIEAIGPLLEAGLLPDHVRFCRVQSSHCEAQDFHAILQNLDHDLLMHLALGFDVRVYDFGSRGNFWQDSHEDGPKYVPRAVWWGLEWSRYALSEVWHLDPPPPLLRGYNVEDLFREKANTLPKPLHKRLKYYRSYLSPGLSKLQLSGYYAQTLLDGKKDAYHEMLQAYVGAASSHARAADLLSGPPPTAESLGMETYDAQTARRFERGAD